MQDQWAYIIICLYCLHVVPNLQKLCRYKMDIIKNYIKRVKQPKNRPPSITNILVDGDFSFL